MIILGVDPGTRHLGYAVIEAVRGKEAALDYGALALGALDHPARLGRIYETLDGVIGQWRPDEVAVEMPIYGEDPQSMLKLGRAQGVVMLAAVRCALPVTQYTPAEVKKAVVGNGRAAKEQVWYMVQKLLDVTEDKGLDASDALAVALCHAHRAAQGPTGKFKDWKSFVAANPGRVRGGPKGD